MASIYDWEMIRAEYEAGSSMGELSRKYGADKGAISRRAKKEGWTQDVSGLVNRIAEAKINGLSNTVDPKKKAVALNDAADAKVAVIQRHREEWEQQKVLCDLALVAGADFDTAKQAKITAEMLKIRQDGERKAWGLADVLEVDHSSKDGSMKPAVTVDLTGMTSDEIAKISRAAFRGE